MSAVTLHSSKANNPGSDGEQKETEQHVVRKHPLLWEVAGGIQKGVWVIPASSVGLASSNEQAGCQQQELREAMNTSIPG